MARLKATFWFALALGVLLEAMLVAAILFWPDFLENLSSIRAMAKDLPVLGDEVLAKIDEQGFPAYVLVQHFFKGCNALGTAAAVLFAAPAIAGEAHRGTLELFLSRPYSRARLLSERWLSGALALTLPVVLTSLTVPFLGERVDEYEAYGPYLACALMQSLFLLAVYALTFLGSCLSSNPTRVAMIALFLCVFQFALYMVKHVTHLSLFRLCDMGVLMPLYGDGRWSAPIAGGLVLTIAGAYAASLFVFRRRCP